MGGASHVGKVKLPARQRSAKYQLPPLGLHRQSAQATNRITSKLRVILGKTMVIFLKPLLELESFLFELAFQDVRNLLAKEHFLNTSFSKMSAAYIFLPPPSCPPAPVQLSSTVSSGYSWTGCPILKKIVSF